jgi:hypothetical protein
MNRRRPLDADLVAEGAKRFAQRLAAEEPPNRRPKDIYPDRATARELVGRGWWPLLDDAFDAVEQAGVRLAQVKEKFGGVRLYLEDGRHAPELYEFLDEIEDRSLTICEACGAPGRGREDFVWRKTLCDGCSALRAAGRSWADVFGYQPYTTPEN